jgi:ParB family chromosome partitioning protein
LSRRGIGRGLAAIIPETAAEGPELRELPLELIRPNPEQPRTRFDPASITSLAASIADAGIVQPLIVRPLPDGRYELIAGERRWRAAREAGVQTAPAIVRDEAEADRLQTALIENVAREDLSPVDESRACAALVEDLGLSKEELGKRIGRSRSALSNLIRILDLPDEALDLMAEGKLSEGHGRAILIAKDTAERTRLARAAAAAGWSVRETERQAGGDARPKLTAVPDADLVEALQEAEDALEQALGTGVSVKATGRKGALRAEIRFEDLDALLEYAKSRR